MQVFQFLEKVFQYIRKFGNNYLILKVYIVFLSKMEDNYGKGLKYGKKLFILIQFNGFFQM